MALSDEERRVLEEMERHLTGTEVVTVRAPRRANLRLAALGFGIFVLGLGSLVAGVVTQLPLLGVIGFGLMTVGVLLMINRRGEPQARNNRSRSNSGGPVHSTLEERWQRRMDGEL